MASTTSIPLPASQAVTISLCDEKALSATGESKNTAIWISDDDFNTEDGDDDKTLSNTSVDWHRRLFNTGTKHGATEPEAATRVVAAPTVPTAQAEDAPILLYKQQVPHLADAKPSRQSSYKTNHILTRDISACQDVNFVNPPISPESQLCLGAADRQQLHSVSNSELSNIMVDAVSD
ncbi:hypothetical protein BKA56DRAFT_625147 [Ilyonectria sp. MPI-CAGE-AT-0026]|nr:hypothetical protein BKA56DRAFT_625147 [Ilyonectria sp. MPI-CAGE-AT-0026]